jgi:hypothetical protein
LIDIVKDVTVASALPAPASMEIGATFCREVFTARRGAGGDDARKVIEEC